MRFSGYKKLIITAGIFFILAGCTTYSVSEPTETVVLPTIGQFDTAAYAKTDPATVTPIATRIFQVTATVTKESITKTPNPFFTPEPTEKSLIGAEMNPLTGLAVENPSLLFRRPVMVKISNYPREIRPQSGLSKADMVFEYYMGQGMNRFLAIFYGEDAIWAGPIRSGRLVDAQLAQMYQGMLVYGGADDRVNAIIIDEEILGARAVDTRMNEVCPPICGEDTHSLEGVFVDTAELTSFAVDNDFEEQMKFEELTYHVFSDAIPQAAGEAVELMIDMSEVCKSKWLFDFEVGKYYRWEETEDFEYKFTPTVDQLSEEEQVGYNNIVLLFSDYVVYDTLLHDIEIVYEDTIQSAIMFRDGVYYNGFWQAKNEETPLLLMDENSETFKLKPGKTWFIFVTSDTKFDSTADGIWTLDFTRP